MPIEPTVTSSLGSNTDAAVADALFGVLPSTDMGILSQPAEQQLGPQASAEANIADVSTLGVLGFEEFENVFDSSSRILAPLTQGVPSPATRPHVQAPRSSPGIRLTSNKKVSTLAHYSSQIPLAKAFDPSLYIQPAGLSAPCSTLRSFKYPSSFPLAPPIDSVPEPTKEVPFEEMTDEEKAWIVTDEDKKKYNQLFAKHDEKDTGYVGGDKAETIFRKFRIKRRKDLYKIWKLSDVDRDGKLTREEFSVAMHLASGIGSKGLSLPKELPCTLQLTNFKRFAIKPKRKSEETLEEKRSARWREAHHQLVAEHMLKYPHALKELMQQYRFHVDKVIEDWTFSLEQLKRIQIQLDEYDQMCDLKKELVDIEKEHSSQIKRENERLGIQLEKCEHDCHTKDEEIAALEAEMTQAREDLHEVNSALRSVEAQFKLEKMDIHHMRHDFRSILACTCTNHL